MLNVLAFDNRHQSDLFSSSIHFRVTLACSEWVVRLTAVSDTTAVFLICLAVNQPVNHKTDATCKDTKRKKNNMSLHSKWWRLVVSLHGFVELFHRAEFFRINPIFFIFPRKEGISINKQRIDQSSVCNTEANVAFLIMNNTLRRAMDYDRREGKIPIVWFISALMPETLTTSSKQVSYTILLLRNDHNHLHGNNTTFFSILLFFFFFSVFEDSRRRNCTLWTYCGFNKAKSKRTSHYSSSSLLLLTRNT